MRLTYFAIMVCVAIVASSVYGGVCPDGDIDGDCSVGVLDQLDVDNFVDYMIMNFYTGNMDWAMHNWYASRSRVDAGGKWRYYSN